MRATPTPPSARSLAWQILQRWSQSQAFAESLIEQACRKHDCKASDRALLQAICFGTLRHKNWLAYLCGQLRKGSLEAGLQWLIMSALFQLLVMKLPAHAVLNESVKLAPRRVQGLVNAMLREAQRQEASILEGRASLPLHLRFSCPEWLVSRWVKVWGEAECEALLAYNEQVPTLYARINPLNPPAAIPEDWQMLPDLSPGSWYAVQSGLPHDLLAAGQLYITDPSTRHCVRLLAPQAGERVLDACAAPGGKSVAMIQATGGQIDLLATDLHEHRMPQLEANLARAGGQQVRVAVHDWAQDCPEAWLGSFDAVLLDLPCSNSGVLQRRVDARWRLSKGEMSRLARLQLQITQKAAAAVKSGGRLVYSTCSIDAEENQQNVARFLELMPEFRLVEDYLALPHREQADGAYAALLVKG